jgi:hypothetical protein
LQWSVTQLFKYHDSDIIPLAKIKFVAIIVKLITWDLREKIINGRRIRKDNG